MQREQMQSSGSVAVSERECCNVMCKCTGHDGNRGLPGPKGIPGRRGHAGFPGEEGYHGDRGPPGPVGLPGTKGCAGARGQKGNLGVSGDKGVAGQNGSRGERGHPGNPGIPGIKGGEGLKGERGLRGDPGEPGTPNTNQGTKGEPGNPGLPGLPGPDGKKGDDGVDGYPGNSGRPGESGRSGDPGYPGHRGPKGPPGAKGMTECDLITKIRENCACCHGQSKCPAYPTELVFGLDMSKNVTDNDFKRQRDAVTSLLEDISITESNCPTGARVAVVGYSDHTNYLIRFQDYRRKTQLNDSVANIALKRTNRRHLGAAMSFVGLNVFKHSRASALMRKVAVFFSNGESWDDILSAIMEYRGLNFVPAIISLKNAHDVHRAMEVDDTGHSIFTLWLRSQDMAASLRKVKNCAICFEGINSYPPPSLKRTCNQLPRLPDEDHNVPSQGVNTCTRQLDVIDISTGVDRQSLLLGAALNETCLLKHDAGGCQKYTMMWFFDNECGECSRFLYSGCGGNSNRFEMQKACEKLCLTKSR